LGPAAWAGPIPTRARTEVRISADAADAKRDIFMKPPFSRIAATSVVPVGNDRGLARLLELCLDVVETQHARGEPVGHVEFPKLGRA